MDKLNKLADYFGVSVDYLSGNEQKKEPTHNVQVRDEHDNIAVLDDETRDLIDSLRTKPEIGGMEVSAVRPVHIQQLMQRVSDKSESLQISRSAVRVRPVAPKKNHMVKPFFRFDCAGCFYCKMSFVVYLLFITQKIPRQAAVKAVHRGICHLSLLFCLSRSSANLPLFQRSVVPTRYPVMRRIRSNRTPVPTMPRLSGTRRLSILTYLQRTF
jgi:hypothetical protein